MIIGCVVGGLAVVVIVVVVALKMNGKTVMRSAHDLPAASAKGVEMANPTNTAKAAVAPMSNAIVASGNDMDEV